MNVKGIKLPYYVKIILIIILDIWLLWSHHGVVFDTSNNKPSAPNPLNPKINTWGRQWPCKYKKRQLQKINPENPALAHYVSVEVITIQEFLSCAGVCQIGRLGVWSTVIATNIIHLTPQKIRHSANSLNAMKIIGWIIIGLNMGVSLILNWPLFISSIPAYIILILLQLDLYSENDEPTKNSPSTTPTTAAIPTPTL
jgi:hypothetical protein